MVPIRSKTIDIAVKLADVKQSRRRAVPLENVPTPADVRVTIDVRGARVGWRQAGRGIVVSCRNEAAMRYFRAHIVKAALALDGFCLDPENNPDEGIDAG